VLYGHGDGVLSAVMVVLLKMGCVLREFKVHAIGQDPGQHTTNSSYDQRIRATDRAFVAENDRGLTSDVHQLQTYVIESLRARGGGSRMGGRKAQVNPFEMFDSKGRHRVHSPAGVR
jgi:hypothetical protein